MRSRNMTLTEHFEQFLEDPFAVVVSRMPMKCLELGCDCLNIRCRLTYSNCRDSNRSQKQGFAASTATIHSASTVTTTCKLRLLDLATMRP